MDQILNLFVGCQESLPAEYLSRIAAYSDQDFVTQDGSYFHVHHVYQMSTSIEVRELLMPGQ
jgi:hypothetical protein